GEGDGTEAGTKQVSNLPGVSFYPGLPTRTQIGGLTAAGAKVYFVALDATYGRQLYASDGTPGGTKLVGPVGDGTQNVPPFENVYRPGANPAVLAADGGRVYFAADDGKAGRELWVSDGTAAGTKLLQDFAPGPASGLPDTGIVAPAAVVNRRLVLAAGDPAHGSE